MAALAAAVFAPLVPADDAPNSTDLIQAYADALKGNAAYQARLAQVEVVNQGEAISHGRLLPQVGFGAGYDFIHEEIEGDYYQVDDIDETNTYGRLAVGVRLTQALYRPDLWTAKDEATLRKSQARFQLDSAEDDLLVEVAEAYFGVLAAQDYQRFALAEYDALDRQLEQVRGRAAGGLVTDADLQAAIAAQAIAGANKIAATSALSGAYARLDLAVGKPTRYLKSLPEGLVMMKPEPADVQAWIERAKTQNQDVLAAQAAAGIANLEFERQRKLRWPRLDAVGGAFYTDFDQGGGVSGERSEVEERIGVDLTVPIYSGGTVTAQIAQASANVQRQDALVNAAVATAGRDAQVSFLDTMGGLSAVPARKTAVEAARAAEASNQAGFDAGTRSSADVLRAVQARYDAERAYSFARYKFVVDSLKLKRSAGNLA
ncbi:MAG TPA: TolC family protein, partial [Nevskiaceae bacterium]|nr:TolC family protein [Nevskiaceae bacterium]